MIVEVYRTGFGEYEYEQRAVNSQKRLDVTRVYLLYCTTARAIVVLKGVCWWFLFFDSSCASQTDKWRYL